jgi:hypothetical protein
MLSDLPFTPSIVLNVAPPAGYAPQLLGVLAIVFACFPAIYGLRFSMRPSVTHTTVTVALTACRSYSSIPQSGIIVRRECLD